MQYITLAIIKLIDNMITTAKSITLYKNKAVLSALLTTVSQFLFFFVISRIISDGSITAMVVVSVSAGLGSYLASLINNKVSKDKTFINIITCTNIDTLDELSNFMYKNKIKCIVYDARTRDGRSTYTIQGFAKTRYESSLIDKYIKENKIKCLREIVE